MKLQIVLSVLPFLSILFISPSESYLSKFPHLRLGLLASDFEDEGLIILLPKPCKIVEGIYANFINPEKPKEKVYMSDFIGGLCKNVEMRIQNRLVSIKERVDSTYQAQSHHQSSIELEDIESFLPSIKAKIENRGKRSLAKLVSSAFRFVKPVTRLGKITRYRKVLKYEFTAGEVAGGTYLMYEAVHNILNPSISIEELNEKISLMEKSQLAHIEVSKHLVAVNGQLTELTQIFSQELGNLLLDNDGTLNSNMKVLETFNLFLDEILYSLDQITRGSISSSLLDLDLQNLWLTQHIGIGGVFHSITPHFPINIIGISPYNLQISLIVTIPIIDTHTPFKYMGVWEPNLVLGSDCYSSPGQSVMVVVNEKMVGDVYKNVTWFNLHSCTYSGIPICESDGLMQDIPDLKYDKECKWERQRTPLKRTMGKRDLTKANEKLTTPIMTAIESSIEQAIIQDLKKEENWKDLQFRQSKAFNGLTMERAHLEEKIELLESTLSSNKSSPLEKGGNLAGLFSGLILLGCGIYRGYKLYVKLSEGKEKKVYKTSRQILRNLEEFPLKEQPSGGPSNSIV